MADFATTAWVWTLAIGLPVFGVVARLRWHQAQQSVWWRLLACVILACAITPSFLEWGSAFPAGGIMIFPAVLAPYAFGDQQRAVLLAVIRGLLPICIVSSVLLGIWSAFIRRLRRDA